MDVGIDEAGEDQAIGGVQHVVGVDPWPMATIFSPAMPISAMKTSSPSQRAVLDCQVSICRTLPSQSDAGRLYFPPKTLTRYAGHAIMPTPFRRGSIASSNACVSKMRVGKSPWVRIPPPPPVERCESGLFGTTEIVWGRPTVGSNPTLSATGELKGFQNL